MTVATNLGLVPILFSTGAGADVMKRIAAPVIGGLLTSLILVLVLYPVIYMIGGAEFSEKTSTIPVTPKKIKRRRAALRSEHDGNASICDQSSCVSTADCGRFRNCQAAFTACRSGSITPDRLDAGDDLALYRDIDVARISVLSYQIFWLVIPSLALFLLIPVFIKWDSASGSAWEQPLQR